MNAAVPQPEEAATVLCRHCGSEIPPGRSAFCCAGCATAFSLIREMGLGGYYARRTLDPALPAPKPQDSAVTDLSAFVRTDAEGVSCLDLAVDGLHCGACVWLIESALAREKETAEARVNLTARRLRLRWRGGAEAGTALVGLVEALGYRVVPYGSAEADTATARQDRELLRALSVVGFAAANVMLLSVAVWSGQASGEMGPATRDLMHWLSALIGMPAVAYAGRPFFRSAWTALRAFRSNMDVPISIGVMLATAMSLYETVHSGAHAYFDSAVTLLFFLLAGRYLDHRARSRARSAAEHLVAMAQLPATLVGADGALRQVPAHMVAPGDTVFVAIGARVPADGRIADGVSSVDTSFITGESLPVAAAPGDTVHAGTLNLSAPLRVAVTASGEKTLLAEIARLMEAAERGRARYVRLADRIARRYAPAVHLLALLTFLFWIAFVPAEQALLNAVSVLIITCPCALGLAVPVVQVIASGRLMRRGILMKSASALERLAGIDTIVFDKTGTLTLGRLQLREGGEDEEALRCAAALAAASRHPLSQAIRRAAPETPLAEGAVTEHPGSGLALATPEGEVRLGSAGFCGAARSASADAVPELWLSRPGRDPHRFAFTDTVRPDAAAVVAALKAEGKRVLLLSGDRAAVVAPLADALGIAEWRAGMAPQDKAAALAGLSREGASALMVGDGINDAPALAAAAISMSPTTASEIAQNAADIVFQGASLSAVTETLSLARRAGHVVRQNLAMAIGYNVLAVPLAMAGMVTPLLAAAAMSSSSLLVIGNALRLNRVRR